MRKNILILSILIIQITSSFGQVYDLVSQKGDNYQPLTDFTSITLEQGLNTGNFRRWEYEFKFGFDFPYFDETYQSFKLNESGFGKIGDTDEFNMYLFAGDYLAFNPVDTPLFSEVRYQYGLVENLKVLKIEWAYVGLGWEIEHDTNLDHYLHYQVWFYENGTIEFHFGDINLTKSKLYIPGKGIVDHDTKEIIGPYIKFKSPETGKSMVIEGSYDHLYFSKNPNGGIINTTPELDWMIQLKYKPVETKDIQNDITISPTITHDYLKISSEKKINLVSVLDINGKVQLQTHDKNIDLTTFSNGIYFIHIQTEHGHLTQKIIKL